MNSINFLGNLYTDATLFEKCRHIDLSRLFEKGHGRLYSMDVKMLLVLDTSAHGITVKKSTIPNPYAGLDLFTSQPSVKRKVSGYYYVSLVYTTLMKERKNRKSTGKK